MPYQSISANRYRHLCRDFLGNRSEMWFPLDSYKKAVSGWARKSKQNMHQHCRLLLQAAANPAMLAAALDGVGRRAALSCDEEVECLNFYPWKWLRKIQARIMNRQYRKGKYEKVQIPKPGKSGTRTIEVPPIETRIVARSIANVLVPLLDPDFYDLSIGFRPNRSPLHGIAAAEQLVEQGMTHWVVCDIRDAFGQLPKQRCLQILDSRLHKSPIMWLVEEILDLNRDRGVPQGVAISPLMLNVYLDHLLDRWWQQHFPETVLIRYADDIAVACPDHESAVACYSALQGRLSEIGFQVKETVDESVFDLSAGERIDWLGFRVRFDGEEMRLSLGDKSWDSLGIAIAETRYRRDKMDEEVDGQVTAAIGHGWLVQKAVAFDEAQIPAVAAQIRDLAAHQYGMDMSALTDDLAHEAWQTAQRQFEKSRQQVLDWLPSLVVAD